MNGRARCVRSRPLGAAGPLEMAARAPSELQGRSKWLIDPASEPQGRFKSADQAFLSEPQRPSKLSVRVRSVLEVDARARSASLGRSKTMLRSARFRWSIQIGRSSPPGFVGAFEVLDIVAQAHSADEDTFEKLFEGCALVANRSKHLARLISTGCMDMKKGPHLIHIYIYIHSIDVYTGTPVLACVGIT